MPKEIYFLETKDFHFVKGLEASLAPYTVKPCSAVGLKKDLSAVKDSFPIVFTAFSEIKNEELADALSKVKISSSCFFFPDAKAATNPFVVKVLEAVTASNRSTGAKNFLTKGSTVYSDAIFQTVGLGAKLDRCYPFAKRKLGAVRAIKTWSALNSILQYALIELPGQGEAGSGERIDLQVGADDTMLVINLRFGTKNLKPEAFLADPLTEVARSCSDFFECRVLQENFRLEVCLAFSLTEQSSIPFHCATRAPTTAMENAEETNEYVYKDFNTLNPDSKTPDRKIKGFKKKFSEKITEIAPDATNSVEKTNLGAIEKEVNVETLIKSDKTAPEVITVVKGAAAPQAKTPDITRLEELIAQKDAVITKLNKEIEEIKDPLKRGVITNIKDGQVDGLKDNIKRLEAEAAEATAREKELMTVVDKAIQLKDDAVKRLKEVETKLRMATESGNSRTAQIEKQLEEAKRQNKELSKKISQMSGLKAA